MINILQCLKHTGEKEWNLEDSANYLLYATRSQVELYSQLARSHYKPERGTLEAAAPAIIAALGDSFNIIGLAAGTSERESILIKAALKAAKRPIYFAIDKSFEMLRESGINVPQRAESYYVLADLFKTDLHKLRGTAGQANLVTFLGYTAFNFGKTKSLHYLQKNLSANDTVIITVGTLPKNLDQLVADYSTPEMRKFGLFPFSESGFAEGGIEFKAVFDADRNQLKFGGVALACPQQATALGIKQGDFIVLAKLLKLPLEGRGSYTELISRYLKIDKVFTETTGMTAVLQTSQKN